MKKGGRFFLKWFGHDRRERRATVVILLLAVTAGISRYLISASGELPVITVLNNERLKDSVLQKDVTGRVLPYEGISRVKEQVVLNLNSCDSADLERLPGIGPVLSARIIKYGNLLGGYADRRQLLEVYGLREDVYNRISGMVTGDTSGLRKINVNLDSYRDLLRHPYFEPVHVNAIVRYREREGMISSWEEMEEKGLVPDEKREFLRFYISFGKYLD